MKKMTLLFAISSLFITPLFALKCVNATEKNYQIEIVPHSPNVKLSRVNIQSENNQFILSGRVKRRSPNTLVFPGHIDVVVKSDSSQIIFHKVIRYSPSTLHKRSHFGSQFNFLLPENLPTGSTIKIKWHSNQSSDHLVSILLPTPDAMMTSFIS